jgi:hypothetical protein
MTIMKSSLLAFCLAALSVAGAGRPLAPRPLTTTGNYPSIPVIAYAGGRFLTVWHETANFLPPALMGAFSDANGVRISPREFLLEQTVISDPYAYQVVGTGDSFTLIWRDLEQRTHLADVDLEGRVTNRREVTGLPRYYNARFAWNGTHFAGIVQWPLNHSGYAVMFDREGRLVLPPTSIRGRTTAFDVIAAGDRFVAAISGFDSVTTRSITPEGVGNPLLVDNAAGSSLAGYKPNRVVAAPAGNGDVVMLWGTSSLSLGELKATVVRADGTRTAESLLATSSTEITPLELLRAGDGYVAAFRKEGALYRVRLDAAGARTSEPELVAANFPEALSAAASPSTILIPYLMQGLERPQVATVAMPAASTAAIEILSINYATQSQPLLGAGGGGAFAAWTELSSDVSTVKGTAVTADGEPRPAVELWPGSLASRQTGWNGVHHLIVQSNGDTLLATRVAADGTVVDNPPLALTNLGDLRSPQAAVAWTGSRWVVVWTERSRLRSATVSSGGEVSAPRTLDVHVSPDDPQSPRRVLTPALAFDGRRLLLVWSEFIDDCWITCVQDVRTYAIRLTRNGEPDDPRPLDLEVATELSLSAASSGSEFLVLAGTQARVVSSTGTLRVTASRELFDWRASSDVTWDGTSYVAALRYRGGTEWYLSVLRLDRAANDAGIRRATLTLPADSEAGPSIAVPFAGNALIGVQEGTIADSLSATVYRELDLAPLPAPPGAPRGVRVSQLSTFEFEVTWDPPAEGNADSYIVEQWFGGSWGEIARTPANVRRARFTRPHADYIPALVRIRAFNAGGISAPSGDDPAPPKRRAVRR